MRGACGLNSMDGECKKNIYENSHVSVKGEGMNCGVMEVVKHSILGGLVTCENR